MPNVNGYFDRSRSTLVGNGTITWADYDASSAGNDWDSFISWQGVAQDLTYQTGVIDTGVSQLYHYIILVTANYPATITVNYGDTLISDGAIDSPTSFTVSPGTLDLTAKKGRYWQFDITLSPDSALDDIPEIEDILVEIRQDTIKASIADLNTSTLGGSVGVRQLNAIGRIKSVTSIVTQPHNPSASPYVTASYVDDTYVATATGTDTPVVYVDKTTAPPTLYIYDIDAFGKRKAVDCTIDAIVEGLPYLQSTANGSIVVQTADIGLL